MPKGVYKRLERICSIDGCGRKHLSSGYCNMHYLRMRQYGRTDVVRRQKGSGSFDRKGYKWITVDGEQRREHVVVAERVLGRRLRGDECVHHINGNKSDNRNENLVICPSNSYHRLLHRRQNALKEN